MRRRRISILTIALGFLVSQASQGGTGSGGGEGAAPFPPTAALSAVMKKGLSGLSFEMSAEGIRRLREQAEEFSRFRRGQMPARQKLLWIAECFRKPGENIFCEYIVERGAARSPGVKGRATDPAAPLDGDQDSPVFGKGRRYDVFKVSDLLSRGDAGVLKGAPESALQRALRLFPNWEPLQKAADSALEAGACPSTALLTALGQKAEEFFPEERARKNALALYARAAECGARPAGEDPSADKARYRFSLLQIWADQCKSAEPYLITLSEQKNGDYVARALYWRAHCARVAGNKLLASVMRTRLQKEFPLSYHGLLLSRARAGAEASRMLDGKDPNVFFRSQARDDVNQVVRGVEALLSTRRETYKDFSGSYHDLALELLSSIDDRLPSTEAPFRIYVAVLWGRAGDYLGQFRALNSAFRDDPSAISRTTLSLFYPLHHFEWIRKFQNKVDPYLVAALIRQESGFNLRARSGAGALGLMQLMPKTARRMERVSRRELFDAKTNIRLGIKYFHQLLSRFENDAELALAAYNAGPEKVEEWIRRYPTANRMLFFDLIPFKETREYVSLIGRNYFWYLSLYADPGTLPALMAQAQARSQSSPESQASQPELGEFSHISGGGRALARNLAAKKPLVFTLFTPL